MGWEGSGRGGGLAKWGGRRSGEGVGGGGRRAEGGGEGVEIGGVG